MKKNSITRKIYRDKTIKEMDLKIKLLGPTSKITTLNYLNTRLIFNILLFIYILLSYEYGYIMAPIITFITYMLFAKFTIDPLIKKRGKKLEKEAVYFFEILTLSLESGRNLYNSLEITASNIDNELSNEFKYALNEVKYGKSLDIALENLRNRVPSDMIDNIILNIKESNMFGNSIIETLHNQIDFINEKRMMEIKEVIGKIPMKISIVSVIFYIPLILLLILGPVIVEFIIG